MRKVLKLRRKQAPASSIMFSEAIPILEVEAGVDQAFSYSPYGKADSISMNFPLFFENLNYEFEFSFHRSVDAQTPPSIRHSLERVNSAFHYKKRQGVTVLSGIVATGNDVGWLRIPVSYVIDGKKKQIALSFEVFPVKIDMTNDLSSMNSTIDAEYPLWRFAVAEKTQLDVDKGRRRGTFPLLWLAQFEALRNDFEHGVQLILNSPHSRLTPYDRNLRAGQIKTTLPPKLAERIRSDVLAGRHTNRYQVTQKRLSSDTPENRFIKNTLSVIKKRLECFEKIARKHNCSPDKQRLSEAFFEQIKFWQSPIDKFIRHSFFKGIGPYNELNRESLVLHQKTGYAKVYRVWQQLKYYLEVLGKHSSISMRSIAELYEVWCFLEIRRLLIDSLGFMEIRSRRNQLVRKGLELEMQDGLRGAFRFTRNDGVEIRLAHEPLFKKNSQSIKVWTTPQQPDILLEATYPDGNRLTWLFDAKYRIKIVDGNENTNKDLVPDDALNQMHRYRDALIFQEKDRHESIIDRKRPIFGAFALYPGFYEQTTTNKHENPYHDSIEAVGIGAFPLLPSQGSMDGCRWLEDFLIDRLGRNEKSIRNCALSEEHYVASAVRIPPLGMQNSHYSDLTLALRAPGAPDKDSAYIRSFDKGTARWGYLLNKNMPAGSMRSIFSELRFCAYATASAHKTVRHIRWVWPIKNISIVKRYALTVEQAGNVKSSDDDCWLLELGCPFRLQNNIVLSEFDLASYSFTSLSALTEATTMEDLPKLYSGHAANSVHQLRPDKK